jgi:glycosyltransferase involved in cell wall biosynthesis
MCEMLVDIMNEPQKYEKMRRNGRALIISNYSWEKVTNEYVKEIKRLLKAVEDADGK